MERRRHPSLVSAHELLNVELGSVSHSWLCNHLEADFAESLGVRLNEQGLVEDPEDAKRCLEAIEEGVGAEPGLWLPWGLVRYG